MANPDLKLLGPGMPVPGMTPFGGQLATAQQRYQELDAAANAEPDAVRRAQLLSERDAVEAEFASVERSMNAPPPETLGPVGNPPPDPNATGSRPELADATSPGLPVPTMDQWMSMQDRGSRGNPAAARKAAADLQAARGRESAAVDEQVEGVTLQGTVGQRQGVQTAGAIGESVMALGREQERYETLRMQHQQDVEAAQATYQRVNQEFDQERAKQGKSVEETWSSGRRVIAHIATFFGSLGAIWSPDLNGRNVVAEAISADIDRELEQRKQRLTNINVARDAADQHIVRLTQELGSVEAAHAAAKAHILGVAELKVQEFAARAGGEEAQGKAQALVGDIQQRKAQAEQKAALEAAKAAQGRRGVSAAAAYSSYLDILGKFGKLQEQQNKNAKDASDDFLDSGDRRMIREIDAGREALTQLQRTAMELKRQGSEYVPGREPAITGIPDRVGRTAAGVVGYGGRGSSGFTPLQEQFRKTIDMTAVATYFAEGGNSANLETEFERAQGELVGNGSLDSLLLNIAMKLERNEARRRAVTRKNTPELRELQDERHQQNAPTLTAPVPPQGATRRGG